ncbi:MAG: hypothetical protein IH860_04025 [Chloroflexi bacterium]|nr:hypothetical protein [Chloroflexota bacterium]
MLETRRGLKAGTIRVGGPTGENMEVGSVPRAHFLSALAQCGHYGHVRLPEDAECEAALSEFHRYQQQLIKQFKQLASQRTRDSRKQKAIVDVLMRKALHWRRPA